MTNRLLKSILLLLAACALVFTSCKKKNNDDSEAITPATPDYTNGVLVTNEGVYLNGTGTISFYSNATGSVTNKVFEKENDDRPIGNVLQSACRIGSKIYYVVNNANRIEIADAVTMKSLGVISITQPRYMVDAGNGKAYVSQWKGSDKGAVAVVDLTTNTVTKTIFCGVAPEGLCKKNNSIYVTNSGFFPSNDDTVTVIDISNETITAKIKTGPNPSSIVEDANGALWVLCNGSWNDAEVDKINPATNSVELTVAVAGTGYQGRMTINKDKNTLVFNLYDALYRLNITGAVAETIFNRPLYSVGIDPSTDILYTGNAGNYNSDGWVLRCNYSTSAVLDSFQVGVTPGNFLFQ
jgi:YVTN family beta-propeller protein